MGERRLAIVGTSDVMFFEEPELKVSHPTPLLAKLVEMRCEIVVVTSRVTLIPEDSVWRIFVDDEHIFLPDPILFDEFRFQGTQNPAIVGAWERAFAKYNLTPPIVRRNCRDSWRESAKQQGVICDTRLL